MALVELQKHHSSRDPDTEAHGNTAAATEQGRSRACRSAVQSHRRGCHAWPLPGGIRAESISWIVESFNALVARASAQQMLRSLQPLLPEVCTGPRVRSTEVQLCHYLMVAHRMSCVSKLVQATLPRQKPHYRGEVPSTVSYLSRIEPHQKLVACQMH